MQTVPSATGVPLPVNMPVVGGGGNGSFLTNSGNDPQLILAPLPDMQGPLKLTISLRVCLTPNPVPEIVTHELGRMKAELDHVNIERDTIANELGRTLELLRGAEDRLRGIQHSLSWRVTGPIRRFMTALRSGPRKSR